MPSGGERLRGVLDGYGSFLREKDLVPAKQQPYLVRWVQEFLLFARAHGGYTFEQTLDLFLAEVGGRVGVKPWQLQQAADAVRIYRYQYRVVCEGPAVRDCRVINQNEGICPVETRSRPTSDEFLAPQQGYSPSEPTACSGDLWLQTPKDTRRRRIVGPFPPADFLGW